MLQKAADIILAFFLALACLGFPPSPLACTSSSRCSACVFCVPTCGKFGKLISSGGLQNFGPNLQNFLTRRKHRKQRRRQRSHLYAFTVFRPVCTKFKWQSMTPRPPLSFPTVRPLHCFRFLFAFARFGCLPFNSPSFFSLLLFACCCAHSIETCGPLSNPLHGEGCRRGWGLGLVCGLACLRNLIDCLISLIDSRIPRTNFDLIKLTFYLFRAHSRPDNWPRPPHVSTVCLQHV